MFFGTTFLEAFGEGLGRVLGGQKPWFSHVFRCFFDAIFEARFQEAKIRQKIGPNPQKAKIWSWIPVVPELLGREKERGYKILAYIIRTYFWAQR